MSSSPIRSDQENVSIVAAKRIASDALNYKQHAEDGFHALSGTSISPVGKYYGFTVGGSGASISAIDYGKFTDLASGDLTSIPLAAGGYYPIKCKSVTLTSGAIILWKNNQQWIA